MPALEGGSGLSDHEILGSRIEGTSSGTWGGSSQPSEPHPGRKKVVLGDLQVSVLGPFVPSSMSSGP